MDTGQDWIKLYNTHPKQHCYVRHLLAYHGSQLAHQKLSVKSPILYYFVYILVERGGESIIFSYPDFLGSSSSRYSRPDPSWA